MELQQYISLIKESALDQAVKDNLVQNLTVNGLTVESLESLSTILQAQLEQLDQQSVVLDNELEAKLTDMDSELMVNLNKEIEADEQAVAKETEQQLDQVEQEFNQEKQRIQKMLTAIETALAAEEARAQAA